MPFEGQDSGVHGMRESPGGFEFGLVGWVYGQPAPHSITFFLDGSAMVCDQYGRQIRRAVLPDREVIFADSPPEGSREGDIIARPQFATHAQVLEALEAERIDWQAYEVRSFTRDGQPRVRGGLKLTEAAKIQARLLQEGHRNVVIARTIACAGWPQLPYDRLKQLEEVPPTPLEELHKIRNVALRRDALRFHREMGEARAAEAKGQED